MARVKKPVTKLTAMHHIGYGAGDAGGVLMLMVISYLERFSRNILGCALVFVHYAFTVERNAAAQLAVKTEEEKEAEKIKVTDILKVFKVNRPYLALCVHSV